MMKSSPRFPWSLIASAALLSIVAGLVLIASLALLVALCIPAQRDQIGGPAVLGAIFVIPASLVLFAEYRTVVRRDAKWANLIAAICLIVPVIGSFSCVLPAGV